MKPTFLLTILSRQIDQALAQVAREQRPDKQAALAAIREQLLWCRQFIDSTVPCPKPGPFSMGLMASRELDMWGNHSELAALIGEVERSFEALPSQLPHHKLPPPPVVAAPVPAPVPTPVIETTPVPPPAPEPAPVPAPATAAGHSTDGELFDVVNAQDVVIGQQVRRLVHEQGLRHRAVHVLVFNAKGEVFLQRRSMTKDKFPGVWDSSASGHVDAGEAYDVCALRELREEIGLHLPTPPNRLFKVNACPQTGQEFVWVYRCLSEGPFTLHPEEIAEGGWFMPEMVTRWTNDKPQEFAPAFVYIWEQLI